ncbi:MAG TPA: aminoglycoside phosphotransferase family protein [Methanocorpusculum sp.]|nr:aminoglycoside phosphotransferase family protein [Methanocorpusculum sp.]
MTPFERGGNNKVYLITINDVPKYIMKEYFQSKSDTRNRFLAEKTFLLYCDGLGIGCVPKVIAEDCDNGILIIEYISGHKIKAEELKPKHVYSAIRYLSDINRRDFSCNSFDYPLSAAEACFSINDHIHTVERRIDALLDVIPKSSIDFEMRDFIIKDVIPIWDVILQNILNLEKKGVVSLDYILSKEEMCISPSDFGFHNAIETDDNRLYFIDFEYAGLDDPVKMICDVFCQPEVPVPYEYFNIFSDCFFSDVFKQDFNLRLHVLFPVHMIKWCCIMLNEFLPHVLERRLFADESIDIGQRQAAQLKKARLMYMRCCMQLKSEDYLHYI